MAIFNYPTDRLALLDDLLEEFKEAVGTSENSILDLESDPGNESHLRALFRSVHTTKGNLAIVGITPMIGVMQALEDVLDLVRQKKIPFTSHVGDVTLLLLDQVKGFIQDCYESLTAEWDEELITEVTALIRSLSDADYAERQDILSRTTFLLDPATQITELKTDVTEIAPALDESWINILQDEDLAFLFEQAKLAEHRAQFWHGRTERLIRLMLEFNKAANSGIQNEELVAALLAHDIAMAYTPLTILNKSGKLNRDEQTRMRHHIDVGYSLLEHLGRFDIARQILLQHHEFSNGEGYPNKLTETNISPGASMMAIVHAFESISHGLTALTLTRRPMARAIVELSRNTGTQFSEKWMVPFQRVLQNGWLR